MWESIFEALFKYPAWAFARGEVRTAVSPVALTVASVAVCVAAAALWTYRSQARARGLDRAILLGLRLTVLLLVLAMLARPVLAVRAAVPQQNVVGILLDDSRSMRIADSGGDTRGAVLQRTFGAADSALLKALGNRFLVRTFRFSGGLDRVEPGTPLTFDGTQTRLGRALQRAQDELAGLPVAGLVVVTDGADTTGDTLAESLLALKAGGVPVYTVGLGQDPIARDIQVGRVVTPRRVLAGTALVVDVPITQRGFTGTRLPLTAEADGRLLASEDVTLPRDGEPLAVRVRFTAEDPGAHVIRFRIPPQPGEALDENNVREVLIDVENRREKILYVEGEPRFEVKFTRNAVDPDENLQLVVLQRTAENKYLRLHVDDANELAAGFPRTRDELFAYRALIIGSMEASALTGDQLRMIAEFVDRRGGGLLMLGGAQAFGEGGYAGTPVADALPVTFGSARRPDNAPPAALQIGPTRAGATHAVTQLRPTERESSDRWRTLPPLTSVNTITGAKPGATVLLVGAAEDRREQIVLASQRYGRGKAIALAVQDTWLWQLHGDIPVEDMTHEVFWRQLLRWLVADVPDRVAVTTATDRMERGESTSVTATVSDPAFGPINTATVVATVTAPSGRATTVPLTWVGERDGEYRATLTPDEDGIHDVRVDATPKDGTAISGSTVLRVAPTDAEGFDAALRAPLLQRLADETGGRAYTAATMNRLPEDLRYSERGITVVEERDLWDMPALLVLLLGCLLGEWSWRRYRGLA